MKRLATGLYYEHAIKLAKSYDKPDRLYYWGLQQLVRPRRSPNRAALGLTGLPMSSTRR